MEAAEYEKLDQVEERMWWFAATHANLLAAGGNGGASLPGRVLDAGCGTGGLLARLGRRFPDRIVVGLDAETEACRRAARKSGRPVSAGSINALPFADGAFTLIFSADVLCHRNVDERLALGQLRRCLAPKGLLVLNLPAYPWMLSRHDVAVHNIRRYTKASIGALLHDAGFRIVYTTYWNAFLFPLMVLTRKFLSGNEARSDVRLYPAPIEAFCRALTGIETGLIRAGISLPFGGSVLAVATKEN